MAVSKIQELLIELIVLRYAGMPRTFGTRPKWIEFNIAHGKDI